MAKQSTVSTTKLDRAAATAGIKRLSERLERLEAFDPAEITKTNPPELSTLETAISRALGQTFGETSLDYRRFARAGRLHSPQVITSRRRHIPIPVYQNEVRENIAKATALLNEAIFALKEDIAEDEEVSDVFTEETTYNDVNNTLTRQIFIVHGHDDGSREKLARFLEKIDLKPIILHEQANKGRTIIEKFEDHSNVGFAIILLTPDDKGGTKDTEKLQSRARQNVILELGYFMGRLGRDRVVALKVGELEIPSDVSGVVWTDFDAAGGWKPNLAKELKAAGYNIDWNKVMED